ncbi:MAG: DNA methylase N-4 [Clostridia bacterium]|nr:DNA methylase N-4 [Clostridia bacterium]
MNYQEFLQSKIDIARETGFEVESEAVNPALKPHQRDAVLWALRGGRRALFESFGLGKTAQQLEWARLLHERTGARVLIVCPLGVKQEFQIDAVRLLGWKEAPPYVRTDAEAAATDAPILLTNYERVRDGDINPRRFGGVSLDEASCIRYGGSKTNIEFNKLLKGIPYKLVCTATPSPNRYTEIVHYSGLLEVMDAGQVLNRFFQRDSTKAHQPRIYPSMEREFWLWVSSWALFIQKPSDLGYDDTGYALPEMDVRWHCLPVDNSTAGTDKHGQVKMIRDAAFSLQDAAKEKRDSIDDRVAKMLEIVGSDPEAHFILWHDLEAERRAIKRAIPEAVEVYGSQEYDVREQRVIDFSDGKFRLLATKKSISGQGCNFQRHCHRAIFLGIDYEFNDFVQAIHRIYRFLQTEKVIIDIIYTESEAEIKKALLHKWKQHDEMVAQMTEIVRRYGLQNTRRFDDMRRTIGVERVEVTGNSYRAINNDCVAELANAKSLADNSVDEIITSIPFGNLFEYSPNYADFGHNEDKEQFFKQMDYLTPNLLRVLKPGRVYACHVKDRILYGNMTGTGMPTLDAFHADVIHHVLRHGFQMLGMITVVTDVVRENNQTYRLGWTECCKDGSKMGVGCPEYILLFRKLPTDTTKAYADEPVTRSKDEYTRAQWQIDAHGFWRSSGDRLVTKEELGRIPTDQMQKVYRAYSRGNVYSYEEHVALAKKMDAEGRLPATFMVVAPASWTDQVWDDINRMRTYNTTQSQRRKQMHVCPLQIDIVDRLIDRYSNRGDTILDPFGGIMTVPTEAVKKGRKGIGIELNTDYFRDGVGYLQGADMQQGMPTLFDFIGLGGIAQ